MHGKAMQIHSSNNQCGATLIESLVSLVILAIAIIGMLGVQVRTLMDTNTAAGRTQAMLLMEDLSERIKANPGGYLALPSYVFDDSRTAGSTDCESSACNSATLAAYDLDQWLANFKATMPGAKVATFISQDNSASTTGNRQLGVLIGWTLRERDSSATSQYAKNFFVDKSRINTGLTGVVATSGCWEGFICHLTYIEP